MNNNDRFLLNHMNDILSKNFKTGIVTYSHFLTPAEQSLILSNKILSSSISFNGGYKDTERRIGRISSNEYDYDDGIPITIFSICSSDKNAEFSHRNVLGSLMSLGIKREMIGDIIATKKQVYLFCRENISEYVHLNLKKIGCYPVTAQQSTTEKISLPEKRLITINVSSMRLDCICAECFKISRTKSAEYIKQGMVTINWIICTNPSNEVKIGSRISMRSKGRVEISDISGASKKGRLFVEVLI